MAELALKLNNFEGPLDLLLHLIEKNKYDIFDIPIVEITDQYIAYLDAMEVTDMDVMSEFLVMAAQLIAIKAKMLLPKEEEPEEEEEDPRAGLVKSLLEYKMYKYASYALKDMELDAGKAFYKEASIPKEVQNYREDVDPAEVIGDTTLASLNEIFKQLIRREVFRTDPVRSKFGTISRDEIKLEDRMVEIRQEIKGLKSINFRALMGRRRGKMNLVVSFLAILELVKTGFIQIRQEETFGEILIDSLE